MNTEKRRRPRQVSTTFTPLSNFLRSIYEFLENPQYEHIVSWNEDGLAFVVKNVTEFASEILPNYFKHNNFTSFIRQLNMYGFHKFKRDSGETEFSHNLFRRGQKNLLEQIKRRKTERTPTPKNKLVPLGKNYDAYKVRKEASTFSADLLSMKNKQNELEKFTKLVYNQNTQLIQENKKIWEEIAKNKDKYARKKEKLTKFIYSMVQQSKDNKALASLTSIFTKKSLMDGDLDEIQKDLILSQSEVDEEKPSKNSTELINNDFSFSSSIQKNYNENSPKPYQKEESKMSLRNQTYLSRRNSIHMDQVPTLEFKPFTIAAKQNEKKHTKKGRSLPFSKNFEEDEFEPNNQKQAKLESRMNNNNNNNLLRSNESKGSYNGRGIGSTHLEFPPEQQSFFPGISRTTSFTYPEFEMPASMSGIQSFHMDQHDKIEFKEDLAHNWNHDTEKTGLIMEKKPEPEPENWEALIASNNWNDFSNNDHKENFFSFD